MKTKSLFLGLAVVTSVSIYAAQATQNGSEYSNWKNKTQASFSSPEENFNQVQKMLLERAFDQKLSKEALYEAATRGMLESLNPSEKEEWNKLYSPEEFKEFQVDASGEVAGIGIEIKFNDETATATVTGLVPRSTAESAGVKIGDQLVSVNDKISKGLQFRDIVYAIRGPVGESVKLKLLRGDEIITKKITRAKLKWSPIEATDLGHQVDYIKIGYFNEKSSAELKLALEKVAQDHVRGLVIDLRENEGGLFDQAVRSASFFTPKGETIVLQESRGGAEKAQTATENAILSKIPLVVLTSERTSSGAELFAAALSENAGAKRVGQKTHGKWSAQTLEKLSNGYAVKFTTSIFKTPSGKSYSATGMSPDLYVAEPKAAAGPSDPTQTLLQKDHELKTAYELLVSER